MHPSRFHRPPSLPHTHRLLSLLMTLVPDSLQYTSPVAGCTTMADGDERMDPEAGPSGDQPETEASPAMVVTEPVEPMTARIV